jgi:hypothetical protein
VSCDETPMESSCAKRRRSIAVSPLNLYCINYVPQCSDLHSECVTSLTKRYFFLIGSFFPASSYAVPYVL